MMPKMMFAMRSGERVIADEGEKFFRKVEGGYKRKYSSRPKSTKAVNVVSLYGIWRAQEGR